MKKKLSKYAKVQLFIIGYTALGTFSICGVYPSDPISLGPNFSLILTFLTLPVSIVSFMYRYFEPGNLHIVLTIQLITMLVYMLLAHIIYLIVRK